MMNRLLGMLILFASLAAGWVWNDFRVFRGQALRIPQQGLVYSMPAGGSARTLARDLAAFGVLDRPLYFRLLARLEDRAHSLKAGEYRIEPGTTPGGLLVLISSGRVIQHPVTLIEGWAFDQLLDALAAVDTLQHGLARLTPGEIMSRLGRPGLHPEGRFLPDTYHFPRGTADIRVLGRALNAMDVLLAEEWAGRAPDLPLNTPEEALILASIVEKEAGLASERPEIAGVFLRRLRKGMLLQTDPTVIYGLGDGFDGNLRRQDLKQDTAYNTYVRPGLPPTPIAMPGRESIRAVLHPAAGSSLYFVARGDGSHQFSATLEDHNRAVRRFQLKK